MLGRAGTKQCGSKAKREGLHHNTVFSTNTHGVNVDLALLWTAVQHLTALSYIHGSLEKEWDKESTAGCIFFAPCVRISSPKIGLVMFSHCLCQTLAKPLFLSGSLAVVLKKKRYQFMLNVVEMHLRCNLCCCYHLLLFFNNQNMWHMREAVRGVEFWGRAELEKYSCKEDGKGLLTRAGGDRSRGITLNQERAGLD